MPGIVGMLTKMPRRQAESKLLRMVTALCHEDFYVSGTWIDESLGLYVGWVARKDSFSDGMPIQNESGDVVLVFSGEEFPEAGTANSLKEKGHSLDLTGPSYLVHLYEEDPGFPVGLNGWFHGLIADRSRGMVTLFNDRYGMHRIYYHSSSEAFYFAAEAKAILAVCSETRRLDLRGMGEFVACGCTLEDRTLFEGIKVLPGASAWVFRDGSLEKRKAYFDAREWEDQAQLEPEAYYREIRDVFSRNLPRYFSGQQQIAMSLTGGLDSRMIMALMRPSNGSLPCYSYGGMFRDCRDVFVARQVARACGQSHKVISIDKEFLSRFPYYAERTVYLTDGCADVSHSPDLYASERAREIAPVRMTGNYGGEVLRRVWYFKPWEALPGVFHPDMAPYFRQANQTYSMKKALPFSDAIFHQVPSHMYGQLALAQTQLSLRSPYLDNDLVRTVLRGPESVIENDDVCFRLIAEGNPYLRQIPLDREQGRRGLIAACERQAHNFLFKAEYAYDTGMPQWLASLDHLLSDFHVERLFLGRHKWYHFRIWYRDALSAYVREMLLDKRTLSRPYLDPKCVSAIVSGHLNGTRNYSTEIHKLLTIELIQRLFIDLA
jgi:asparagine synthase (glutamine-hydrolysing)